MLIPTLSTLALSALAQQPGGAWEFESEFLGPRPQARDGRDLAVIEDLDGDGLPDVLSTGSDGVKSYVRIRSGKTGQRLGVIVGQAKTGFGGAICAVDDLDGDGLEDIAVGAPRWDSATGTNVGRVVVFSSATKQGIAVYEGGSQGQLFGSAICRTDDHDGDGVADLVVGSPGSFSGDGAIQVISLATGSEQYLYQGPDGGQFGFSVNSLGDVDGDGYSELGVGAIQAPVGALTGRAYVFNVRAGQSELELDPTASFAELGHDMTTVGDQTGDGVDDYLVLSSDVTGALLYSGADGAILRQWFGWDFGRAIVAVGDVNGDGLSEFILAGREVLWMIEGGSLAIVQNLQGDPSAGFGHSMVGGRDFDGDGRVEAMIGATAAESSPGAADAVGAVLTAEWGPLIFASTTELSASAGGSLGLRLEFPSVAAGLEYRVLISLAGTGPTDFGVEVPLTLDPSVLNSWAGSYWPLRPQGAQGLLDSAAEARPKLVAPGGALTALVGQSMYVAAIALVPNGRAKFSSTAVAIDVLP